MTTLDLAHTFYEFRANVTIKHPRVTHGNKYFFSIV